MQWFLSVHFDFLDDAQVPCMWSQRGNEYSGRISHTCDRKKCVPWARAIHKLRDILNITDYYSLNITSYYGGILSKFPDRSLVEASNYCRNPSNSSCGPWCYTSLVDDSWGRCCVPECSAANKGKWT